MKEYHGRTVVVVGGSSGIGLACAKSFWEKGANVIIAGRDAIKVKTAEVEIAAGQSSECLRAVSVSVLSESDINELLVFAKKEFGHVDILVNCAAEGAANARSEELSIEDWQRIINTDLTGTFLCCKIFGKDMLMKNYGRIINLASFHTVATYPQRSAYVTAKCGVVGLTQALAVEWGGRGVTVNAISPGPIATPRTNWFLNNDISAQQGMIARTPTGRIAQTEEVAHLATFLASELAGHISGQNIIIDGAWTKNAWWGKHPFV